MSEDPKSSLGERWTDPVGLNPEGGAPAAPTLAGRYFIVGARPVKTVAVPGGGLDVQAFDWDSGEFVRAMQYLSRVVFPDGETDEVTAEDFESQVQKLRAELGRTG
jgi:hypothetical protein